jgi:hypothetical protein
VISHNSSFSQSPNILMDVSLRDIETEWKNMTGNITRLSSQSVNTCYRESKRL